MPWHIEKRQGEYCVIKDSDGFNQGCHATRSKAEAQLGALYASEAGGQKAIITEGPTGGAMPDHEKLITDWSQDPQAGRHPFLVWKQGDEWRWLAVYSNKFRDDDYPPEILAEAAHKDFVAAVDNGDWPYPELWLWHTPGTKCGQADFVAYDDRGFALAAGVITNGEVAQGLAKERGLLTSHGMPRTEIVRDPHDPTVLLRYRTKEISPLPAQVAANKLTGFVVSGGKDVMAMPDEKKSFLQRLMGDKAVEALEHELDGKAAKAEALELESKDAEAEAATEVEVAAEEPVEPEAETEPEAEEEPQAAAEPEAEEPKEAAQPAYVTQDELKEMGEAVVLGFQQMQKTLEQLVPLAEVVKGLQEQVDALQQTDEAKMARMVELTPAASLAARIRSSVIGTDVAKVDGRSSLAKSGPEESKSAGSGARLTGVPILDTFLTGDGDWRKALGPDLVID